MTAHLRVHSLAAPNGRILFIGLLTVLTVTVQTTQAQSYLLTLSQNQLLNPSNQQKDNNNNNNNINKATGVEIDEIEGDIFIQTDEDNSTVIVVKNPRTQTPAELSQSAMDVITIVWYVATFLALAAFFLLMACSDRRCANNQTNNANNNNNETPLPPPTPSPSYSEFAPPSYETVMKTQHASKTSIFVIPFGMDNDKEGNNNNNNNNNSDSINNNNNNSNNSNNIVGSQPNTPTTPLVTFYTLNELQKFGS